VSEPAEARFEALLGFAPARVLAVGAHPDDAEFFAGATLAQLVRAGVRVSLCVCTDGSRGGRGLHDAAATRRAEQSRAAAALGVAEVVHLPHRDGELAPDDALRRDLVREIRRLRPELVLAHDPQTWFVRYGARVHPGHSDHRAAGQATLDAIYPRAASPNFYPEQVEAGLAPWYPRWVWLFDTARPDLCLDASGGFAAKLEALALHESQNAGGGLVAQAQGAGAALGTRERPAEAFLALRLL
jgi:LmbE family N-acetylglucosaminyl deacetylase